MVFFIFIQILIDRPVKTVETLIRSRVLRRLIWVYTVCICPTKMTLGIYGLIYLSNFQYVLTPWATSDGYSGIPSAEGVS